MIEAAIVIYFIIGVGADRVWARFARQTEWLDAPFVYLIWPALLIGVALLGAKAKQ